MYGFRKPFTAASYSGTPLLGFDFKTVLVVSQVLGYTASKFLGIKVVAEVTPRRRARLILQLVGGSWSGLLLFALTPTPWNVVWLFGNGLMLGMVFGLVLGFVEGRRHTEALAAGLCGSFIVADGVTKSVGAWLLEVGVSEHWMPFLAGLLFAAPLTFFVWMLSQVAAPSPQDVAARSERVPMDGAQRRAFYRRYATGLSLILALYLLVTILRSVRADFAPEIWRGLDQDVRPSVFALSESAVALLILVLTATTVLIRDNRSAFFSGLGLAGVGVGLLGAALVFQQAGLLSPFPFMVMLGVGLYLPYLVVHATLFERLLAATRERGNIGYLMYLADSFGYLGYVGILLLRGGFAPSAEFLVFFLRLSWAVVVGGLIVLVPCWIYFSSHTAMQRRAGEA